MNFELDDDTQLLQRTVRDFARAGGRAGRRGARPHEVVPLRARRQDGRAGLDGDPVPGGVRRRAAATTLQYAIAVEELTRIDSTVAITMCAHTSLGTQPVYLFGSEEQKQRLMPDLCAGAQARRVRADRARGRVGRRQHARRAPRSDGGVWAINGAKQFITNAGTDISGHVAITARDRRATRSRT